MKKFLLIGACIVSIHSCLIGMADMALMMGAQLGATLANQMVSGQFASMSQSMMTEQNNLENSMSLFQNNVQATQQDFLKNTFLFFQTAQSHTQSLMAQQNQYTQQLQAYIFKAMSLQQPQSHYLETPSSTDQLYTIGTMYTPSGPLWKNIFPIGNWLYDEELNSFWQMTNEPLLSSQTDPQTQAVTQTANQAPNNSIFTDWITRASSYTIICNVTIYQTSYPFFVGIIFNKARWISGDMQRLQQYRLVGIYATSPQSINAYFSEEISATQNPLDQIVKGTATTKIIIDPAPFATLSQYPVTYTVKIITTPSTIKFKIWQSKIKEPSAFTVVSSKNSDLFLYHGIGFMSPGAMSQFKIIKPTELLFSSQAVAQFTSQVKSLLQKGNNQS